MGPQTARYRVPFPPGSTPDPSKPLAEAARDARTDGGTQGFSTTFVHSFWLSLKLR